MSQAIVIPDLIDTLPFHDGLSWEKFESFCADVLFKKFNSVDTRKYLIKGSTQKGIDIYSLKRGEVKWTVAQCKLYEYLSPQQVWDAIDDFLNSTLVSNVGEFILCTSADLGRQRDEENTIAISRAKLKEHGIELIVWDERGMSKELRTDPSPEIINIVYRYFGEGVALSFYGQMWTEYIRKLMPVKKRSYITPEDYIERNIISYSKQTGKKSHPGLADSFNERKNTLIELFEKKAEQAFPKILLLSTAGFGKTQEMKNIAAHFSCEDKILYPIKFILSDYAGQTIESILSSYDGNWQNIPEENILLLFDGLDEVGEIYYLTFIKHLNAFIEQKPGVQAVISSRFNFYDVTHPQLRGFEIFLLYPLDQYDIQNYIDKKLGINSETFRQTLKETGFDEYLTNPYYLTRLVRLYNTGNGNFPKNKSELFNRILFEQLENDQGRYNIAELKETLFPIAKQIAFCMTLSGKSVLTDEELKTIIPNQESRTLLNRFSIFNRNATAVGAWAFEHKNLQEYLCALIFANIPFFKIHKIISLEFDPSKLLPRFLNTISFLFEIIDKGSATFEQLFTWINENNYELLIRFEKEQLSVETRHGIFQQVVYYYKEKGITMRASQNFSYEELALFGEVDNFIIDFVEDQLKIGVSGELAYDMLSVMGYCKRAYRYKSKLLNLLFSILKTNTYPIYIQAKAISVLTSFEFNEQVLFDDILNSGVDLNNGEIRKTCLYFLESTNYFENYSQFIFESVGVLATLGKNTNSSGHFGAVKRLLLKFDSPGKVKEIFKFGLAHQNCFKIHSHYGEFHFDLEELKKLLNNAGGIYTIDKSIVGLVYKVFCTNEHITFHPPWFIEYKTFFEKTCGLEVIFKKLYKYQKQSRDIMSFADLKSCDYLIKEYKKGKLTDNEMITFRNQLSWLNRELFPAFYYKLAVLDQHKFVIDDIDVDYNLVRLEQDKKNQLMLLDRTLFFQEAEIIFAIIAKDKITAMDVRSSETPGLRKYENSIVVDTIRQLCIHNDEKIITKAEFFEKYSDGNEWEGFVIDTTESLLDDKEKAIDNRLLTILGAWCKNKIEALDFENCLRDNTDGETFNYSPMVEFVKKIFLKLDLDLDDKLLVKMLPADYDGFGGWNDGSQETISSLVINKVKDKDFLRTAVIDNIKNGKLTILVLCSHYTICYKLGFRQCLPYLFQTIVSHPFLKDYHRVKLTGYYLELGGEINDFMDYLQVPDESSDKAKYSSWHWYLIENLLFIAPVRITGILLQILNSDAQPESMLTAAQNLIQLSKIEGLEYMKVYVEETKRIPFEHKWASLQQYIVGLPAEKAIDIFLAIVEFSYKNGIEDQFNGYSQIQEALFDSLSTITATDYKYFNIIKDRLGKMTEDNEGRSFSKSLKFASERFTQFYYQSHNQEFDIQKANLIYSSISQN